MRSAGTDGPKFAGKSDKPENTSNIEALAAYGEQLFDQSIEEWDTLSRTNVTSVFFVTTAFLGLLAESAETNEGRYASVINISSAWAHSRLNYGYVSHYPDYFNEPISEPTCIRFSRRQYAYDCSKAAVSHLTKLLATDLSLKRAPIRVNAISPGTFPSELTATSEQLGVALQGHFAGALVKHPMRRPGRYVISF